MGKYFLSAFIGVVCGVLLIVVLTGGVVVLAHDPVIHALNGKTGAEYTALSDTLTKAQADLTQTKNELTSTKDSLTKAQGVIDTANGQISELQDQLKALNTQITGLKGQLSSWNTLLCAHTWAEATNKNMVFAVVTIDKLPVRQTFNNSGFDLLLTQWKNGLTDNTPTDFMVQDLKGGIIFDITKHCVILESAVGLPA